jgi:glyoxylase-like metal-dependent hydrolase (beta-lactamase superfamily II)
MGGHSIEGIAELLEKDPVKIFVHKLEAEGVKKVTGVSDTDLNIVESGDHLTIGENDIEFLHTPGHTPGSQCFKVNNNLVSGDTLFVQGCGRVDLPGSNSEDMFHSLQKLSALPNETILYPGHNYSAEPYESMERVKEINTYLRIEDIEMWKQIM